MIGKIFDLETISQAITNHYVFKEGENPIPFYIPSLDEKEYALYRGEPNVIIAQSGVGKTTLMVNIVSKDVIKTTNKHIIVSQEMTKSALSRRIIAVVDGSYESKWREYKVKDKEEFNKLKEDALKVVVELDNRVMISDKTYTLSELLKLIDYAILNEVDAMFVDYFQLVEYDLGGSVFSENEKMKKVSSMVKEKIKGSKLMFCWLAQVIEDKKDARNDYIKGTSQLKNDAAGILNIFVEEDMDITLKMIVTKDRHNGNKDLEVEVAFDKGKQRIGEFAKGRLINQSISHKHFVKGVQHIPIQQKQVIQEATEDDLPF
jgi:replicative DNA helicase